MKNKLGVGDSKSLPSFLDLNPRIRDSNKFPFSHLISPNPLPLSRAFEMAAAILERFLLFTLILSMTTKHWLSSFSEFFNSDNL